MNKITQLYKQKIEPSTDRVNIFLINFSLFNPCNFIKYLSDDEIDRADKIRKEERRQQFIISRGIIKKYLSILLSKRSNQIKFLYNKHGKPYINEKYNSHTVEFNSSHSGNYGLTAITLDNKIGVDIQKIDSTVNFESLSDRFFNINEKNELMKLNKDDQKDAFYLGWVRKESFIKATGKGIAYGLNRFSVTLNKIHNSNPIISNYENKNWYCHDLIECSGYKMALTTSKSEIDIVLSQDMNF